MGGPTEDVDGEGGDVEHHHGHEEVVTGAEDLTCDRNPLRCPEILHNLRLRGNLVNNLEQPLRLDQLGQTDNPTTLENAENVPEIRRKIEFS